MKNREPIDAVITWVDGDDPAHQKKLNHYLASIGRQPKSAATTRFRSVGEIDYCVASLIHYAPFIRNIFIITDNQVPALVKHYRGTSYEDKVHIIDHTEVFRDFESVLPTFNSISIETVMYRIEGLAEQFIYLNDDFFLMDETQPEYFFQDGLPVLRGQFEKQAEYRFSKRLRSWLGIGNDPDDPSFKRVQELAAKLQGFDKRFWRIGHVPHPLQRSTFEAIYEKQPELLAQNIGYKLRHAYQFSPISLANHWQIKHQLAVLETNRRDLNIKPGRYSSEKLKQKLESSQGAFGCIQSLDQANEVQQKIVLDWLDKKVPKLL